MSRLCRFFVILIAAYTAAGCSAVGSIDGSDTDLLWVVPTRLTFKSGESFVPSKELRVYVSYQGVAKQVTLSSLVEISIAEDPNLPNDLKNVPLSSNGYMLEKTGIKIIVVKYSGLNTSYTIEVSAFTDSGSGITVKWP